MMAIEIKLPDIGSDEPLEVTEIMVKVGDKVSVNQSLITVEGDKASVEIPALFNGIVKEIKVHVGDQVSTGSNIMLFEDENTLQSSACVFENTDSVTFSASDSNQNITLDSIPVSTVPTESTKHYNCIHATPIIRRIACEFGINLSNIKGSGRKGRILREDIQAYIRKSIKYSELNSTSSSSEISGLTQLLPWPQIDFNQFGDTQEIELTRIQKISGANLSRNWIMAPHVTQFDEVDITEMESFRKQQNAENEHKKLDIKITPLAFIVKAAAKALEEMPRFNSSLSVDAQRLILKKYINIGIAVNIPNGLVVPVLKDANKKGILDLSIELAAISKKARSGKTTACDMKGGSFTISSLGSIGGSSFTPIINAPEVAILGISKSSIKAIWNGKKFEPRIILPLALSYDHRVIDGVDGVHFISFINKIMSNIRRFIL